MASKKTKVLKKFLSDIKTIKQLSPTFTVTLKKYLQENIDSLEIRSDQFIFNKSFYKLFVECVNIDINNTKTENLFYINFKRLKRFGLIHPASSNYPKGKSIVSINPNNICLIDDNFDKMDMFIKARQYVMNKMKDGDIGYLYLYLKFFHAEPLAEAVLSKLIWSDVIVISDIEKVVLYTVRKTFISEKSSVYKLIVLDEYASKQIISTQLSIKNSQNEKIFYDLHSYEKLVHEFRSKYLNGLTINSIKMLNKSYHIFNSSPLQASFGFHALQTVELTLKEIETLFPGTVPTMLMIQEEKRISDTFSKKKDIENKEIDFSLHTDILDLESLVKILRHKKNITVGLVDEAIEELEKYKEIHKSKHAELIYDYIVYLLLRLKSKGSNKIGHRTLKNNVWILNNYIFRSVENLEDMKDYEISEITQRLDNLKLNSQKTTIGILRRFFEYHELKSNFKIDVNMVYYPKSMIFDFELDNILKEIDNLQFSRQKKYNRLLLKVFVLIAYYFGLRKNEIRHMRVKDIIFHPDKIYIDVNSLGFKNFSLKTSNSRRRVEAVIKNSGHKQLIEDYFNFIISKTKESGKPLFRNVTDRVGSSVLEEGKLDVLNVVIHKVVKRYCTFHSLRHSFATYAINDTILARDTKNPYEFFNKLSTPMGHSLPEASANSYVHWNIIQLLQCRK